MIHDEIIRHRRTPDVERILRRVVAALPVATAAEARAAAEELGYPVVLKALASEHKSDAGGVVLGIADADELDAAYTNHEGSFNSLANQLSGGYAYAMGYQDASGQLHGLRIDNVLNDNDLIPVMADRPSFNQTQGVFAGASPNSGVVDEHFGPRCPPSPRSSP